MRRQTRLSVASSNVTVISSSKSMKDNVSQLPLQTYAKSYNLHLMSAV